MTLELIKVRLKIGELLGVADRAAVEFCLERRDLRTQLVGFQFDVFLFCACAPRSVLQFAFPLARCKKLFAFAEARFGIIERSTARVERGIDLLQLPKIGDKAHLLSWHRLLPTRDRCASEPRAQSDVMA